MQKICGYAAHSTRVRVLLARHLRVQRRHFFDASAISFFDFCNLALETALKALALCLPSLRARRPLLRGEIPRVVLIGRLAAKVQRTGKEVPGSVP